MGIAIAGAIFLGPKFEDAQSQSLGSSSVQAVTAVASAVNSYRMATGYAYGSGLESADSLVTGGYLRAVPANPVLPGRPPQIIGANGSDYIASTSADRMSWSPKYVYMSVGTDRNVCTQVMRMLGHYTGGQEIDPNTQLLPANGGDGKPAGCFRTAAGSTQIAAGDYVVFARIGGA